MKIYLKNSTSLYYSLIASLPLLLGYEILITLTQTSYWKVRNAADVWIRSFLQVFEIKPQFATLIIILILIILIPIVKIKFNSPSLDLKIFFLMLVESLVYSFFLGIILHFLLDILLLSNANVSNKLLQNIALSLGAGLFEEFFFRVLLLNFLFWIFQIILKTKLISGIFAILIASFLFSLSHYIGNMADTFEIYSFFFRWMAGLVFTLLYFFRGFAITAYTHAFYDVLIFI